MILGPWPTLVIFVALVASLGCDSFVRARLKVVTPEGALANALIRRDRRRQG
jgi:hypothetical protein